MKGGSDTDVGTQVGVARIDRDTVIQARRATARRYQGDDLNMLLDVLGLTRKQLARVGIRL